MSRYALCKSLIVECILYSVFCVMSMLQAAPRGLLSLVGAHVPEAQGNNINNNNNNNNSPPRAPLSRQQPAANARVDAACPHCAQRSAP